VLGDVQCTSSAKQLAATNTTLLTLRRDDDDEDDEENEALATTNDSDCYYSVGGIFGSNDWRLRTGSFPSRRSSSTDPAAVFR